MTLSNITAILLVGGIGSRLRSVVSDRPKVLASIGGRPFLSFLLDQLADAGILRTVLCTGYLHQQVRHTYGDCYRGMEIVYSQEKTPLGTGGALKLAHAQFESDTVLVMNGDSYCECDIANLWHWHSQHSKDMSIVLTEVSDSRRYGRVKLDENDNILRFDEKTYVYSGSGWVNAGIYLMPQAWIDEIPANQNKSLEHDLFPNWISRRIYGYRCDGNFIDIGTPQSFRMAETILVPACAEVH